MASVPSAVKAASLCVAVALLSPACAVVKTMGYVQTGETREIDATNGDTLVTAYWRYANGEQTVTFLRSPRGNEHRRTDHPLPPTPREVD